jgi:hypothetical protein
MRQLALIITVLVVAAVIIVMHLPPKTVTLEQIYQSATPSYIHEEHDTIKTTVVNNPVTVSHDEAVVDYYIIVQSYMKLEPAEVKAKKFKKEFEADFTVLPPTPEGYYRISCGRYSSLNEAKSKLKSIRDLMGADVWLLSVKK